MTPFRPHAKGITVALRLTPGARKEAFGGLMEDGRGGFFLKLSVNAPPEDGRANAALLSFLAREWGLPKDAFSLLSGQTRRQKVVLVGGESASLLERLKSWAAKTGYKTV